MSVLPQLIVNSLIAAGTYAILAMGFSLIYGTTKFFNLAHGVMAAVGGYCMFWLLGAFSSLPLWLMVIVSVIVAGLLGYLVDRIVYLPLRKRKASNMVLLVASLGAFTVVQAAIAMIFTSQFQTLASRRIGERISDRGCVDHGNADYDSGRSDRRIHFSLALAQEDTFWKSDPGY